MPGPNAATPPGPSLPARTIVAPTLTPPRPLLIGDHWDITRTPGFLLKGETDVFLGKGRTLFFFFVCLVSYPHLFRTRQQLNKYYIEEAAAKNQRNKGTEEGEWSYQISNSAVRSDFDFFGLFFFLHRWILPPCLWRSNEMEEALFFFLFYFIVPFFIWKQSVNQRSSNSIKCIRLAGFGTAKDPPFWKSSLFHWRFIYLLGH